MDEILNLIESVSEEFPSYSTACVSFLLSGLFFSVVRIFTMQKPSDRCITVKILKFGTPQTIAIIVLKIEKFDVTLH